ncbi:MAG: hypothetical protein COA79_23995 [Planctomycetota bacterium]|nr:MAG: hypothetical protein COA79_23995 [Planctomycetota bacterium]
MNKENITNDKIKEDIISLGIKRGDLLLVHSSLSSIGFVDGGADTVITCLLEVIGEKGTLLMPAFQGGSEFVILSEMVSGKRDPFDLRTDSSELGKITEVFRQKKGVVRSISPTHSTCGIGPLATEIFEGHSQCKITTGLGSPYEKICLLHGKILLLGVGHGANTTLHFIENTNGAPTISSVEFNSVVIDMYGKEHAIKCYSHMPSGLKRDYPKVDSILTENKIQNSGTIGMADSRLINAFEMMTLVGEKVRENPLFLINPFKPE